jgi:hypothetical protein
MRVSISHFPLADNYTIVSGGKWGEITEGEIYIPQHHVVEGNNTLAT